MNRAKTNLQRGDTIIEVLMSMSIIGLVLASAFAIANRSYAVGISAQERTEALKIAESQVELLRLASDQTSSDLLNPVAGQLFCIDSGSVDIERINYTSTVQETNGVNDPINYPASNQCSFGSDNRYNVSIEQTGTNEKIFSVRVRWESILGGQIEEVNHVYRTYDFESNFSLSNISTPAPTPTPTPPTPTPPPPPPIGSPGTIPTSAGLTYIGELNGHYYYLSNYGTNWDNASSIAVGLGGYLVNISSNQENNFLLNNISGVSYVWLGLNDAAIEGTYVWSNGETNSYTRWASGQPDNGSFFDDDAVALCVSNYSCSNQRGRWFDSWTAIGNRYVVEFDGN